MGVKTNAGELAKKYKRRAQRFAIGVNRGLYKATHDVNNKAVEFLGGSNTAPPGSFPIPNRTGNLFRGQGAAVNNRAGFVFNTAAYAEAIHQDRPWLDRAVDAVNVLDTVGKEASKEVLR